MPCKTAKLFQAGANSGMLARRQVTHEPLGTNSKMAGLSVRLDHGRVLFEAL